MPDILDNSTVVIPSYKPDSKLLGTVSGLLEYGFTDIIVVDDGGGQEYADIFAGIEKKEHCRVLRHEVNRGKGAAMKTAFRYLLSEGKPRKCVVTVDGDGQHLPKDAFACCEKCLGTGSLVLGARDFSKENVPAKSMLGNRITSFVFLLFFGMKVSDTQTGLRAFPSEYLADMAEISGDRYEYETNMLLEAKNRGFRISEQIIETVYIDNNSASHFRPFRDSMRIYSLILRYIGSSLASSLVDILCFWALYKFAGPHLGIYDVAVSTVTARAISSVVNYLINRNVVFRNRQNTVKTFLRYAALCVMTVACSSALVYLVKLFIGSGSFLVTLFKVLIDVTLFFVTFRVQRQWVFRKTR